MLFSWPCVECSNNGGKEISLRQFLWNGNLYFPSFAVHSTLACTYHLSHVCCANSTSMLIPLHCIWKGETFFQQWAVTQTQLSHTTAVGASFDCKCSFCAVVITVWAVIRKKEKPILRFAMRCNGSGRSMTFCTFQKSEHFKAFNGGNPTGGNGDIRHRFVWKTRILPLMLRDYKLLVSAQKWPPKTCQLRCNTPTKQIFTPYDHKINLPWVTGGKASRNSPGICNRSLPATPWL